MKQLALITLFLPILLVCNGCTETSVKLAVITNLAESGDAAAQTMLGNMYAAGAEVPQDFAEALRWFSQAAEQGHSEAQYFLGVIYSGGHTDAPNLVEGYIWFCLAAKSSYPTANEDCEKLAGELSSDELVTAKAREDKLFNEIQKRNAEG
jgi:TPR repeat protein